MQGRGYDQGFHEIHQISPWNLADLTCEIQWISPRYHLWNPPKIIKASVSAKTLQFDECRVGDFTQISPVKSTQNYKSKCFSKNSSVWWMQGGGYDQGFHEIHQISPWNWWISPMKSGRFHPDLTCEIHPNYKSKCFSKNSSVWWMQGRGYDQGFHEIHQISPWNLADLTCEIQWISPRYHLWNPPKIIKASVSAKTLQFDECRVGDFTLKSGGFHPWNLADFTQISPVKSTQNYKSKCFSKNSSVWWMQGGGFHPEIWWISTMKSSGFHPDLTCEIHPKL